jgi:hypothetical protein
VTAHETTRYRVTFDRLGRKRDLVLECEVTDADDLAEKVYRFAGQHLSSRDFEVVVGLDPDTREGRGWIEDGRFGAFTVAPLAVEVAR